MSIKKKKKVLPKAVYCQDCERAGRGIFCTGECKKRRKK